MKFTLKWLSEYVSIGDLSPEQLADRLTMLGLEVEAVQDLSQGLEGILTAKIVEVRPHPDADRLTLCTVEVGDDVVPVVCGAPNVRAGLVTAIALPGVTMPGGLRIKKARLRGQESRGMLCSGKELGISSDDSGILELDEHVASGVALVKELGLDDIMVEIDLTPNRPDCASVIGIAREVAALTGSPLQRPVDRNDLPVLDGRNIDFSAEIREPELCPRYAARKLTGVTIGPSPGWLQQRLLAVGMRPINNLVDITNFVMLEYGQPLHAFDFKKLAGGRIVVRRPAEDEKTFTTLDGSERTLEPEMLLICDQERPVAVAGIMGGLDSEVTGETTEVLLESACFDPVAIRKAARRLNLSSESSYRFERGVDPDGVDCALQRAVNLIEELAGGKAVPGGVDEYPGRRDLLTLPLRTSRVCDLLGMELDSRRMAAYLQSIEFGIASEEDEALQVVVPSFRVDIEREIDLVEEIARLAGYNDIPTTLPLIRMDYPQRDPLRALRQDVSAILLAQGFSEAINYSFVSEKQLDVLGISGDDERLRCTRLLNPLTEDQAVMRTMLLPGLLENIKRNINFQQTDIRLFEIGKIFLQHGSDTQPEEKLQLCAVMSGQRYPGAVPLYFSGRQADIFDIKGVAQSLLTTLRITGGSGEISFVAAAEEAQPYSQEGMSLLIMDGERVIGGLGRLDRGKGRDFGIKQDVFFLELDLETLCHLPRAVKAFKSLPRYPSVKRDIALLVPEQVAAGDLLQAILEQNVEHVERAELFDVYRGKPIEKGMKSVALSVTYRSLEQTLADETVDRFHKEIVHSLMSRFGGRYRGGQEINEEEKRNA
ncbi:phenylalanine--tRNA ligase beta subunit [bacterium BMS3Bbin14]|nr:phenylalanine--tRNA ligase beta subunit [bacterium BMS3Abin13]GBE52863.1 phenylalanine--tRNA ligase beta subunit [bacterium BMS3Bbin14]